MPEIIQNINSYNESFNYNKFESKNESHEKRNVS